jgi:uncharacterized protein (DUF736 family)|tara:strand:- start:585 stop:1007 length:423 start_codon:yes stop_codon:yes gene_type:complete
MNGRDDTNSGILFKNTDDWTIIQQGKLNIDGGDHRIIGVKRLNKEGNPIVELYRAIGTLKVNEDKQSEKSPDAKGVINKITDLGAMTISAWKEKSEKGNAYTSLKLREFSNEYNQDTQEQPEAESEKDVLGEDLDDEIPF